MDRDSKLEPRTMILVLGGADFVIIRCSQGVLVLLSIAGIECGSRYNLAMDRL